MNIALIGYGKMGQLIHSLALSQGHQVPIIIDPSHTQATHPRLSKAALENADVCIDFTNGKAVLDNVKQVVAAQKPIVIGTTGWEEDAIEIKLLLASSPAGAVYGANFCIGVQLFYAMVQNAAQLLSRFSEYAVAGIEYHHSQKRDSPSGTALKLTEIVQSEMGERTSNFAFNSVRSGHFPGTHTLLFDSLCDTIELRHTARSRQGFAEGALMAAHWIQSRQGFHTIEEMILEIGAKEESRGA